MQILGNRVLVTKLEVEQKEGFQTVEVENEFLYKGKVEQVGEGANNMFYVKAPPPDFAQGTGSIGLMPDREPIIKEGSTIMFAKYSPHTQEFKHEGVEYKVVRLEDVIAVL